MSEELKAVALFQPDIPFEIIYVFADKRAFEIYHDPYELDIKIVSIKHAEDAINNFDNLLTGGNHV